MKLLADESVDKPIIDELRKSGFIVRSIVEITPGIADDKVIDLAYKEQLIILTSDKDFGKLIIKYAKPTEGVILLRLNNIIPQQSAEIVTSTIQNHADDITGNFCVISHSSIRIRKLKK